MRVFILLVFFALASYSLTCSVCGHRDCCPADACSLHCREMGKSGGACKFTDQEDRCICYCYRGTEKDIKNSIPASKLEQNKTSIVDPKNEFHPIILNAKKAITTKNVTNDSIAYHFNIQSFAFNIQNAFAPQCSYGASRYCQTWKQCVDGCNKYFGSGSNKCLLGYPGAKSGCCVCLTPDCGGSCAFGRCPCSMGCGCQ